MSGTSRGYSPRRAGEVVGVSVRSDEDRPVHMTISGHAHTYEFAWRDTANGPVITDLRVTSGDGTPITSNTLRRINTDTLARAARRYDTSQAADAARQLRRVVETATAPAASNPAAMVADAIAWSEEQGLHDAACELRRAAVEVGPAALVADGLAGVEAVRWTEAGLGDALARHAPPGVLPEPRRVGRPKLSREFLAQVADWARKARDYNIGAVYVYVAEQAAEHVGHVAPEETVKGWIRRCKSEGLLGPDELRRPRTPRAATDITE